MFLKWTINKASKVGTFFELIFDFYSQFYFQKSYDRFLVSFWILFLKKSKQSLKIKQEASTHFGCRSFTINSTANSRKGEEIPPKKRKKLKKKHAEKNKSTSAGKTWIFLVIYKQTSFSFFRLSIFPFSKFLCKFIPVNWFIRPSH